MAFCAVADSVRSVAGELPRTAAAPRQQLLLLLRVVNYIFQMLLPCPTEKPCTYVAYKRGRGSDEGGGAPMLHGATASVLIWNTCCSSLARSAAATVAAFRICPAATSNSLGMCTQRSLFSFALASVSPSPRLRLCSSSARCCCCCSCTCCVCCCRCCCCCRCDYVVVVCTDCC